MDNSAYLAAENTASRLEVQMNSFLVLSSGRKGARVLVSTAVLADSWFARPKKTQSSVWLVGVGKSVIASEMDLSTK